MFRFSSIEARKRFAELAIRLLDLHLANHLTFEVAVTSGQVVAVEIHRKLPEFQLEPSQQNLAAAEVTAA